MRRRLPLLAALGLGVVLWRGGFGVLATDRTVTWRFPVRYAEVRRLDLQLWTDGALVKREQLERPAGLEGEPVTRVPLPGGRHQAIATLWLSAEERPRTFQRDFDPGMQADVVLSFEARAQP